MDAGCKESRGKGSRREEAPLKTKLIAFSEIEQKRCSKNKMKERLEIGNKELKKWFLNKQKYINRVCNESHCKHC